MAQLKKLTFKELKDEFEKLMKSIESFMPMGTEERVKSPGVQLKQESSKKQKTIEEVPVIKESATESVFVKEEEIEKPVKKRGKVKKQMERKGTHADKTTQHEAKEDMEALVKGNDTYSSSGTDIPVSAIPVAIKPPSIANWKIIKIGKKGVYQIIREDRTYITYINFGALLKSISKDDLTELYRIVMQRVHCLTLESADIYMLTKRRYPIPADVCQAMLDKKLQGDKKDEACYQLLKLIEKSCNGVKKDCLSVGLATTQQMVISSPCLTDIKNWLVQSKRLRREHDQHGLFKKNRREENLVVAHFLWTHQYDDIFSKFTIIKCIKELLKSSKVKVNGQLDDQCCSLTASLIILLYIDCVVCSSLLHQQHTDSIDHRRNLAMAKEKLCGVGSHKNPDSPSFTVSTGPPLLHAITGLWAAIASKGTMPKCSSCQLQSHQPDQSADKSLPLFKTLKKCTKKGDFRWTTEAEEAFTLLKQHIAALPTLVAPRPGEELIIYLSATHGAISAVLLTDRDSVQTPVYFVSKALKETEINYSAMEKLILALVFAAKRLRRYFQAHPIAVITDQPIKQVISKPDASGRLQKWSVLLGEHNISYRPRTAVKGQILADFLIEKPETDAVLPQSEVKLQDPWILFTDGSSCVDGSGAGLILTNPEGMEFTYALRFEFTATNNEAEYEALIAGLRIAARMGVRNLEANVDSRLVANHVLGEYVAKEDNMIQYLDKTKSLIQGFDRFTIRQVPRGDNKKADALSKIASTSFAHLSKQVLVEILKNKSISEMAISTVIEEQDPTWMTPIVEFVSKGTLPLEQKEARRIRRTAQRFELRNGVLYRRSFLQPWLRCVGPIQADYVLREIHAGSCSMHSGPRSVVARALRSGYYWPTMHRDARDMIRKCHDCQVHRPIPRQPQQELTPITSPWPFHKWGIDIAGPFPVAAGGLKFLIVAIDYFTKWIEARAVATITGNQRFASVKHPQTNGLVERANRSLGEGIKARLDRHKGRWVEELSHVLWAHRTTIKGSTGDTPFSLAIGTEAVRPAEIRNEANYTYRVVSIVEPIDAERRIDLDILEERREQAAIREEKAKSQMKGYYDAKVRGVSFRPGDFVYRANDASHAEDTGKLGPSGGPLARLRRNFETSIQAAGHRCCVSCPARGILQSQEICYL
ncbi:reverse transcriptase domain-containing protein [Tanacetum coccineum]